MSRNATHRFNSTLMQNVRMISGKGEGYYPSLAEFQQLSIREECFSAYLTLGRLKSDKAHPPLSLLVATMRASMNPVIRSRRDRLVLLSFAMDRLNLFIPMMLPRLVIKT